MGMLLKTVARTRGEAITRALDRATRDPQATQKALLLDILRRNRDTEYGKGHGFSRIGSEKTFARAVPINTFSDFAPYVQRMMAGEHNLLTTDPPCMFALTSGTTAAPKHLPVLETAMAREADISIQWLHRALRDHPSFLDHSALCMMGPLVEGNAPCGTPYGSASGMMYGSLQALASRSFVLPRVLADIKDYALRYYLAARLALEQEISFAATPNPATLIRIAETGIEHSEAIVRAIHDGILADRRLLERTPTDAPALDALGAGLKPNRLRARFLEQVIHQHDGLLPFACWKTLRLIGCWLGGSIGFQTEKLSKYYGTDVPRRDLGYRTSEGSFTIPDRDGSPAGILALRNHYYEFVPDAERTARPKRPLGCHEIEPGRQYRIIVTNGNGLYRYDMNDIVEVHDFYNRTPRIAFVRKGGDMLNIAGEKLHLNHFLKAFQRLKEQHKVSIVQFRIVPNYEALRCEIFLQADPAPSRACWLATVLPFLDDALAEANIEYAGRRRSKRLKPPRLHIMDASWEDDVRRSSLKTGHRDIQHKWRMIAEKALDLDTQHVQFTVQI